MAFHFDRDEDNGLVTWTLYVGTQEALDAEGHYPIEQESNDPLANEMIYHLEIAMKRMEDLEARKKDQPTDENTV